MRLKNIYKIMIAVIVVATLIFVVNNYRSSQVRKVSEYEQNQATNADVSDYRVEVNDIGRGSKEIKNKSYLPIGITIDYSQSVELYEEINHSNADEEVNHSNAQIDYYQVETIPIELQQN